MTVTYVRTKQMIGIIPLTQNGNPRFLALFHLALRVIFGHCCCASQMSRWKGISKKHNISSGALLFWSLMEFDLFCGSAAFSVLWRKKFSTTLQIPSPQHLYWGHSSRLKYMRRLSTEGETKLLNKKVINFGLKNLNFWCYL